MMDEKESYRVVRDAVQQMSEQMDSIRVLVPLSLGVALQTAAGSLVRVRMELGAWRRRLDTPKTTHGTTADSGGGTEDFGISYEVVE